MARESRVQATDRRTGPSMSVSPRPQEPGDGVLRVDGSPGTYHGWGMGLHPRLPVVSWSVLPLVVLLAGCGGDVRSQDGAGGERVVAEVPAVDTPAPPASPEADTPVEEVAEPEPPREEVAPSAPARPAAAPPPAPVPAPVSPPREEAPPAVGPPGTGSVAPERTDVDPPSLDRPVPAEDLPPAIPAGTELVTRLTASLETGVNQAGDAFTARVDEDLLAPDGMVMVRMGSEIRGRVLEARESRGPDDAAVILLQVETLVVDGVEIPVRASVIDAEVETSVRDSNTRTAAKVATGAAAGAVLGRILGRNGRSTTAGAVAGAAAGTAVALATRDGQAVMAPGARIVIRFDEPVPHLD